MRLQLNPFIRGYRDFTVDRVLAITDDCEDRPILYRPLHDSQRHLRDVELHMCPCMFCDDFAIVAIGHSVSADLQERCLGCGTVRAILYAISADDFGTPVHVGDAYSADEARELVRRLTFETGHFNRCWEISSQHVSKKAMRYLEALSYESAPPGLLFEAFRVPPNRAIGCKLMNTPWTDNVLEQAAGLTQQLLRHSHLLAGVPDSLVRVLHSAATTDTRILILDPHASMLAGLLIDDDWMHPAHAQATELAHGPAIQQPVRELECSCCGGVTIGRQWWKREPGFEICTRCVALLQKLSIPFAEMTETYGNEGVHYNCTIMLVDD